MLIFKKLSGRLTPIRKINQNHDEKGRFSSGSSIKHVDALTAKSWRKADKIRGITSKNDRSLHGLFGNFNSQNPIYEKNGKKYQWQGKKGEVEIK